MLPRELIYFVTLTILIVVSPFLPTSLLLLLDNLLIRTAIVFLLLYLIRIGPTAGILGLMGVSVLYLERNRRKVAVAIQKLEQMDTRSRPATIEEASQPQLTVPVPPFETPGIASNTYLPADEPCDITNFEPVAPTINQKAVLSSIYSSGSASASDEIYEKMGFGHL